MDATNVAVVETAHVCLLRTSREIQSAQIVTVPVCHCRSYIHKPFFCFLFVFQSQFSGKTEKVKSMLFAVRVSQYGIGRSAVRAARDTPQQPVAA